VLERGEAPLQKIFPLSFKGEGDKGGEVDKYKGKGRRVFKILDKFSLSIEVRFR